MNKNLNKVMHVLAWVAVIMVCHELADRYIDQRYHFDAGIWACIIAMVVETLLLKLDIYFLEKRFPKKDREELEHIERAINDSAKFKEEMDRIFKAAKEDFEKEWDQKHNNHNKPE